MLNSLFCMSAIFYRCRLRLSFLSFGENDFYLFTAPKLLSSMSCNEDELLLDFLILLVS